MNNFQVSLRLNTRTTLRRLTHAKKQLHKNDFGWELQMNNRVESGQDINYDPLM